MRHNDPNRTTQHTLSRKETQMMPMHRSTTRRFQITMMVMLTLIPLIVSGCSVIQLAIPPEGLNILPAEEFNAAISKEDVLLIDVHTPEQAHIKGTDHLIPHNDIDQHLAKFPSDPSTPIYLYCKTGHMVNVAARTLFSEGYTNVYNLEGGTRAWEKAGYPVEE